jgi:hypothetical protein
MKEEPDYAKDLAEIRSMMEKTSKFLSLAGWAGIMAGLYALVGAYVAYSVLGFNPDQISYSLPESGDSSAMMKLIGVALAVLILSIVTAIILSSRKATRKGEKVWNATSRRLVISMSIPLVTGGVFIMILFSKGLIGLIAPMMLLFYGKSLYIASRYTIDEVKYLGMIQMGLGLISAYYIEYGLLLWAVGFGVMHIVYGIYMYIRYER